MKILVVHNSYQEAGGEDAVVAAESSLLREHGHEVTFYRRDNAELAQLPRAAAALGSVWSQRAAVDIGRLCQRFLPDLIHAHNTFPLISAAPFWGAHRRAIPVVQSLHNFRLLCPQAMFLRNGAVCQDCLGKLPWRAVRHGCYHASALQTGVVAAALLVHRALGTYRRRVGAFIALSDFSRQLYVAGGLPARRLFVKPNFVFPGLAPAWQGRDGGLFVGRLAPEKGLDLLIEARRQLRAGAGPAPVLRVAGAGPLAATVVQHFGAAYLGRLAPDAVRQQMHRARFVIAPSRCLETFGLVAAEAFSCGTAVIASRHGGLGEVVEDGVTGLHFTPGDAADLARKIGWAAAHPAAMEAMGRAAYARYLGCYTPAVNYRQLLNIYRAALAPAGL